MLSSCRLLFALDSGRVEICEVSERKVRDVDVPFQATVLYTEAHFLLRLLVSSDFLFS